MRKDFIAYLPLWLFLIVFIGHFGSKNITSFDSKYSIHLTISIINEGDTDLDEYSILFEANDYRIERIGNHTFSIYPIGSSLIALPIVWTIDIGLQALFPLDIEKMAIDGWFMGHIEEFIASIIVALTTAVLYKVSILMVNNVSISVLVAMIFAFGTSAWSTASRGLWQHGPSMLMLAITLYLLKSAEQRSRVVIYAALPLSFSFWIRPTNAIPILLISLYVLLRYRNRFVHYLIIATPAILAFVIYDYAIYGNIFSQYYYPANLATVSAPYYYVLAANLISPNRGLFVFTPIMLFGVIGFLTSKKDLLGWLLVTTIALHWLAISSWRHWWGGWQFGPRFFTDILPLMFYFVILSVHWLYGLKGQKRVFVFLLFFTFALASIFIHYRGANSWSTILWNESPAQIDSMPSRVWDWSDIQFLRPDY